MILTLEDAIEREESIATENERFCAVAPPEITASEYHSAKYHRQIAGWLKELAERKTGKWVLSQNQIDWGWDINCSVCGKGDNGFFANGRENAECKLKHQYLMDAKKKESMRYCNYCGAKMEVEE